MTALDDQPGLSIRRAETPDLSALLRLNEAAVPGVNSLTEPELAELIEQSAATFVALQAGTVVGFLLLLPEGLDYASLNYAWISQRYDRFCYVDRVAVAPEMRGRGVGRELYRVALTDLPGYRDVLLCEVNLEPPNPGSVRFHKALGFEEVGQRWLQDRSKGVVYLARAL